jgi:hypothetical protein
VLRHSWREVMNHLKAWYLRLHMLVDHVLNAEPVKSEKYIVIEKRGAKSKSPKTPRTMDKDRTYYLKKVDWQNPKYCNWLSKACHPDYVSYLQGSPTAPPPKDIREWVFDTPTKYINKKQKEWRVDHGDFNFKKIKF